MAMTSRETQRALFEKKIEECRKEVELFERLASARDRLNQLVEAQGRFLREVPKPEGWVEGYSAQSGVSSSGPGSSSTS